MSSVTRASAMLRSVPPSSTSPLRRPVALSPQETRPSPWSLVSQQPAAVPPSPRRSLTPLLDAIGRGRRHAVPSRSDADAPGGGPCGSSPRKVPAPGVGRGGGLPPGLTATLGQKQKQQQQQLPPALGKRGVPKVLEIEDGCICQREHAVVLCHVCGWYSRCRLMKPCREHPNTRFLLDLAVCPRCRAPSYQMDEYDMGGEELPPCQLLMPEPAHGPPSLSRRSTSPVPSEGRGAAAAGFVPPAKPGALRTRMRPPLQSDSFGMQRKLRDRFAQSVPSQCIQLIQTPSGLPLPFGDEGPVQRSPSVGSYGSSRGRRPGEGHQRGSSSDACFGCPGDSRRRF